MWPQYKRIIPYVRFAFANLHLSVQYAIYVIYIICLAINELPYVLYDQTTASWKSHRGILRVVSMKIVILSFKDIPIVKVSCICCQYWNYVMDVTGSNPKLLEVCKTAIRSTYTETKYNLSSDDTLRTQQANNIRPVDGLLGLPSDPIGPLSSLISARNGRSEGVWPRA